MTFQIQGDSLSTNSTISGASVAANSMAGLSTPADLAVSGNQAADLSNLVQNYAFNSQEIRLMIGTNDVHVYKGDAAKQGYYKAFLRASLASQLFATKQLARAASGITYVGTWGNTAVNTFGKYSDTALNTASGTFSGDVLYLYYIIQAIGSSHTAKVFVDGNQVDLIDANAAMSTQNGASYAQACNRYSGFGAGSHTWEIQIITGGNRWYFNSISDLSTISGSGAPTIKLGNLAYFSSGYNTANGITNAMTDAYNAIISAVVTELTTDGFDVRLVDINSIIDPAVDVIANDVHWHDSGHAKAYTAFQTA